MLDHFLKANRFKVADDLHFYDFWHSVSPMAISFSLKPVAWFAGGSVLALGLMTQFSTFALAADCSNPTYTTTQSQSLNDGDTICTTANNGYGLWAYNTTLVAPANNVITTSGNNAYGLYGQQAGSSITATDATVQTSGDGAHGFYLQGTGNITSTTITTTGANAAGVYLNGGASLSLVGVTINTQGTNAIGVDGDGGVSEGKTITIDATTSITAAGDGVTGSGLVQINGTHVTSTGGMGVRFFSNTTAGSSITGNAVIVTKGSGAGFLNSGVWSNTDRFGQTNPFPLVDKGVSVETYGDYAVGVVGTGGAIRGLQVDAATVITHGANAYGARAAYGATTILNDTHITTHGANAAAAAVGNLPGDTTTGSTITITGADLKTTGDGSNAVQIYGDNDITMDAATSLSTSGVGSHGISLQGGVSRTYDTGTKLARTISVTGKDSAAFHSTDTATNLVITNAPTITLGSESWTALAEDGGAIQMTNFTFGIAGVWARGASASAFGTVYLAGTTTMAGGRLRADANGIIDISGITDKTGFSIGSLYGDNGTVTLDKTNLTVDGSANTIFGGHLTGTGSLIRGGTDGSLTLTGQNAGYTSDVSVTGGGLYVDGSIGGKATVTGGTLGGSGTIGKDVSVSGGGNLAGRQGQVLTIDGNLTLAADGNMNVTLGKPEDASVAGLFKVGGDVTLGGKLNITDLGGFAPGLYRLIDYTGTLVSNTMIVGDVPGGSSATQMSIQTNVDQQVNLLNMSGVDLNFWDGGNMANHDNGSIDGGVGTWNKANTNWTDQDGTFHGSWADGQFAIFTGTAGVVTVDNSGGDIVVDGMQFAVDGYRVEGDAITLQDGEAIIRVGVGNGSGKDMTATIASELTGNASLNKMDHGTLILIADNSYTGGTTISEGTLQLGDGGTTGSVKGDIINNATLAVNRSGEYILEGKVSGSGNLLQHGSGITLILMGENTYSGGTTINAGTLQLGNGGISGSIKGNVTNDGILAINRSDVMVFEGAIGGTGALQQNGSGTTILTGESSYSGGTVINAGILQIGNGGTTGSMTGDITNNGTLSFNRADQLIFSKVISGSGSVTQDGAGTTLMTGANSYSGATRVNAGTLQQKMHGSFSAASDYYVAAGAVLDNGGYKTTINALDNSGTVRFGENPGAIINIAGNYTGNNSLLIMNAELNGDSSKTDLLKVSGDTSGATTVKVINRGGLGAQTNEGIKIIEVSGQTNGTFSLAGDYTTKDGQQAVVAGAYAYSLHEGGISTPDDGDWYLRSELKDGTGPVINPGVPLYQGAVQAMQALNKLPTLQQRVGNRDWDSSDKPESEQGADAKSQAIWGRIEGAHNRLKSDNANARMKQDLNTFIIQAGIDGQLYESESGKLIGGITGQYGTARSNISSRYGDGRVNTDAWGLGGALTWYGESGFYADAQAQANWYDNDFDSTTANRSLANGRNGFGYALGAEAGQRFALNNDWSVTPQAQLLWSSVSFDGFNDIWDTAVAVRDGDSLTGRIGLSVDYRNAWQDGNGQLARTSLYGIANLYQEFLGDMRVNVAGVNFGTGNDKTWGGVGAGGTYAWADDKYALYGEGSLNTSLSNFAKSYAVKGTVGFRARW